MNDASQSIDKARRYYRLLVAAQALMFAAVALLLALEPWPCPGKTERMHKKASRDTTGGLRTTLEMFKADCGRYPQTSEGLNALVIRPGNISAEKWHGPYFDPPAVPPDPWGHEYVYRFPAVHSINDFDLYSLGPDGVSKSGGADADDIGNWEKPWSPGFTSEDLFGIAMLVALAIPFLYVVRIVVATFSLRFGVVVERNRWADRIWCSLAVIVVLAMFCIPKC
jgi:type II secretion system protein G